MGQHGHRNMFYATGLPGWMRFGYSPGWGGMPPGAQYLQQTGQLNQAMDWFGQQPSAQPASTFQTPQQPVAQSAPPQPAYPPAPQQPMSAQPPREQEIQMLEDQLAALENQIGQIRERINQLRSRSE